MTSGSWRLSVTKIPHSSAIRPLGTCNGHLFNSYSLVEFANPETWPAIAPQLVAYDEVGAASV
jgi:hypothetical protein